MRARVDVRSDRSFNGRPPTTWTVMIASSALYEIISAVIFGAAKGAQARPPKMADEDADRRCGAEI